MEDHSTKLANAMNTLRSLYQSEVLLGESRVGERSLMENELIDHLRGRASVYEEEAIDLTDQLCLLRVLVVAPDGNFYFNEKYVNHTISEVISGD